MKGFLTGLAVSTALIGLSLLFLDTLSSSFGNPGARPGVHVNLDKPSTKAM